MPSWKKGQAFDEKVKNAVGTSQLPKKETTTTIKPKPKRKKSDTELKQEVVSIRIPVEDQEWLRAYFEDQGLTFSSGIRWALRNFIKQNGGA